MRIVTKSHAIKYQDHTVFVYSYKASIFGKIPIHIKCNCCTFESQIILTASLDTIFDMIPYQNGKKNELRTYLLNLRKTLKTI